MFLNGFTSIQYKYEIIFSKSPVSIRSGINGLANDASWFPKGQPQQRIEEIVPLDSNVYESTPARHSGFCQSVNQPQFPGKLPECTSSFPPFDYSGDRSIKERSRLLLPGEQEW
jgi:hypothetical protein